MSTNPACNHNKNLFEGRRREKKNPKGREKETELNAKCLLGKEVANFRKPG